MRVFFAASLWAAATIAPAMACNADLLVIKEWTATSNEGNSLLPVSLTATVEYGGEKPYRMIHAGVMLADVLGRPVGQVNLAEDQQVSPGDAILADGLVDADERLLTINHEDIVGRTCVWSIVYDDGQVEKF